MKTLKSKVTSLGLIELKQSGCQFLLYINGTLRTVSADLEYVMREYDNL